MPTHKNFTKTQEILKHLERYGYLNRSTAAALFQVYDLPDYIRRINKREGYEVSVVSGSSPNTKYKLESKP